MVTSVAGSVVGHVPAWGGPALTAGVALAGCVLVAVVDPGTPGRYPVCPFLALTGRWCPGCGTLRGLHALTRADVPAAMGFNPLMVVALPLLAYSWLAWAAAAVGGPVLPRPVLPAWAIWLLAAVVMAFWVLRNLPGPFAFLAP